MACRIFVQTCFPRDSSHRHESALVYIEMCVFQLAFSKNATSPQIHDGNAICDSSKIFLSLKPKTSTNNNYSCSYIALYRGTMRTVKVNEIFYYYYYYFCFCLYLGMNRAIFVLVISKSFYKCVWCSLIMFHFGSERFKISSNDRSNIPRQQSIYREKKNLITKHY